MDKLSILFRTAELLTRFVPDPKPPKTDYTPLYEAIPNVPDFPRQAVEVSKPPQTQEAYKPTATSPVAQPDLEEVSTACLSCSRSHLSTVSGALGEACRFARGDARGIMQPEVQKRIMMSEDEINMLERIDLSPDALQSSPTGEREVAERYLPDIRKLRQDIGNILSFDDLEKTAADANILGQEFRLATLQLRGVDLNPIIELAKKVKSGELSMEEAKAQLKEILPEEESE